MFRNKTKVNFRDLNEIQLFFVSKYSNKIYFKKEKCFFDTPFFFLQIIPFLNVGLLM